jgi:hypothetical protein
VEQRVEVAACGEASQRTAEFVGLPWCYRLIDSQIHEGSSGRTDPWFQPVEARRLTHVRTSTCFAHRQPHVSETLIDAGRSLQCDPMLLRQFSMGRESGSSREIA